MSEITRGQAVRVGVDLAKRVIQVHAVDAAGHVLCSRALARDKFIAWCAQLPGGCIVAMETSSSSHHWARKLIALGLDARIIAAQLVSPYRRQGVSGKNDANDAAVVCEAASRPQMHFVPVKSIEQQSMLCVHRLREGLKAGRVAHSTLMGIVPIGASAAVATVGDFKQFDHAAQFGAWIGRTPRRHSSGGKNSLGGITKRGDNYLRSLLIQGAKSVVMPAHKRSDPISVWAAALRERMGWQKAAVPLANKNARIQWAVMTKGEAFNPWHVKEEVPSKGYGAIPCTWSTNLVRSVLAHPELMLTMGLQAAR
jgi:transposase